MARLVLAILGMIWMTTLAPAQTLTDAQAVVTPAAFEDSFDKLDTADWHVAEYDFGHPHFDTDWRKTQVLLEDQGLTLRLTPHDGMNRFAGGSVRRQEPSHYGRYEARLQAARGEGLVTGFFTYTGPHYGARHDEIDIEILGRDTTRLHVAWFTDGVLHSHFIDLGFDAAEAPHDYAFDWQPDGIRWFVDGREVFSVTAADGPLPQMPGRLFANLWAADARDPGMAAWSGTPRAGTEATARILSVRHIPSI